MTSPERTAVKLTKEQIANWLDEAADDIASWGAYASEYFQKKHHLDDDAARYKQRAADVRALASLSERQDGQIGHSAPALGQGARGETPDTVGETVRVLRDLEAFVSVMCGHGPDAIIPETIRTPLGIPVKIGEIMRDVRAILRAADAERGEK